MAELRGGIKVEENFRWISSRYHRPVFHFFANRRMLPDRCEDLTQEVFLRVYRSISGFRGESSFQTWLFRIVWNLWRSEYSSTEHKVNAHMMSLEETVDSEDQLSVDVKVRREENDPLAHALSEERRALLHQELEKMPAQMRRCITLRVDRELKYREIAELMQISIDAVKSHLGQARARLKLRLGEP